MTLLMPPMRANVSSSASFWRTELSVREAAHAHCRRRSGRLPGSYDRTGTAGAIGDRASGAYQRFALKPDAARPAVACVARFKV
jgi:hypothetical protein